MRRIAAAGVAVLVVLCLSGCGRWFVQHDVAEEPLREQIEDVASVVEIASSVDGTFGATVAVRVDELVAADIHTIVARADELLAGRDVKFQIALGDQGLLSLIYPLDFSADEIASEVDYWLALSSANEAPLGMLLQDGPYRNIWDPDKDDKLDWDALRAVPDTSTAELSWYLDDMVAKVTMPTPDVIALHDRVAAIQVGDDEELLLDYFAPGYALVRYISPDAGLTDPTASASWPRLQEAVSEIKEGGPPAVNLVFHTEGSANGGTLHFGECATLAEDHANWASAELFAALTSANPQIAAGVGAGFCDDAY